MDMKKPRISLKRALALTVGIGVAAYTTYGPRVARQELPTTVAAVQLCKTTPSCRSATVLFVGQLDRTRRDMNVTFDFGAAPAKGVMRRLEAELAAVHFRPWGHLVVAHLVNGAPAVPPASTEGGPARRSIAGGAK